MKQSEGMGHNRWIRGLTILGLIILAAISIPCAASADGPGTVCVLQIQSTGAILGLLANQPTDFSIAVLVPEDPDKITNVPVTCDILGTLALAMANQTNSRVTVTTQVFSNQGELICSLGSMGVPKNGARGIVFSGCQ
jgi:hypothetical protein